MPKRSTLNQIKRSKSNQRRKPLSTIDPSQSSKAPLPQATRLSNKIYANWIPLKPEDKYSPELFGESNLVSILPIDIRRKTKPAEFLDLFLNNDVLQSIAQYTNSQAHAYFKSHPPNYKKSHRSSWYDLTSAEVKAYISIMLHMGIISAPTYSLYWTKDPKFRIPGIAEVMGRDRFHSIKQFLCLYDPAQPYMINHALAKLQAIQDHVSQACKEYWIPMSKLTIDESMIAFTGIHKGKVHMPRKPVKDGFKMYVLTDYEGYAIKFFPSFGREDRSVRGIVFDLMQDFLGKNYHVFMDK